MKNFFKNERHNETANNHFNSLLGMLTEGDVGTQEFHYAWDMFRCFMDHFRYMEKYNQAPIQNAPIAMIVPEGTVLS